MNIKKFNVGGLRDEKDILSVRDEVQHINGVHTVRVDNISNTITVEYDASSENAVQQAINKFKVTE